MNDFKGSNEICKKFCSSGDHAASTAKRKLESNPCYLDISLSHSFDTQEQMLFFDIINSISSKDDRTPIERGITVSLCQSYLAEPIIPLNDNITLCIYIDSSEMINYSYENVKNFYFAVNIRDAMGNCFYEDHANEDRLLFAIYKLVCLIEMWFLRIIKMIYMKNWTKLELLDCLSQALDYQNM